MLVATLPLVSSLALGAVIMGYSPNDGKMKKRGRGSVVFALCTLQARLRVKAIVQGTLRGWAFRPRVLTGEVTLESPTFSVRPSPGETESRRQSVRQTENPTPSQPQI